MWKIATVLAAVAVALLASPAFAAADYTPWLRDAERPPIVEFLELAQKSCCKKCSKGQPRGNTCISKNATCRSAPGCAC